MSPKQITVLNPAAVVAALTKAIAALEPVGHAGPRYNTADEARLIDLRNAILREPGEYLDEAQVGARLHAIMKGEGEPTVVWFVRTGPKLYRCKNGGSWLDGWNVTSAEQVETFATEEGARCGADAVRLHAEYVVDQDAYASPEPPQGIRP